MHSHTHTQTHLAPHTSSATKPTYVSQHHPHTKWSQPYAYQCPYPRAQPPQSNIHSHTAEPPILASTIAYVNSLSTNATPQWRTPTGPSYPSLPTTSHPPFLQDCMSKSQPTNLHQGSPIRMKCYKYNPTPTHPTIIPSNTLHYESRTVSAMTTPSTILNPISLHLCPHLFPYTPQQAGHNSYSTTPCCKSEEPNCLQTMAQLCKPAS